MKLLKEYIRELLFEAAKGVEDLPENTYVKIWKTGPEININFSDANGNIYKTPIKGVVTIQPVESNKWGNCSGAMNVKWASAESGYGPLLYDVAIEYATLNGNGLMADRMAVSPEAVSVWQYYLDLRSDVTAYQLDNLEGELTPDNKDDDCSQDIVGVKIKHGDDWTEHPLSKRYTKPPRTIGLLRKAGKLIEEA